MAISIHLWAHLAFQIDVHITLAVVSIIDIDHLAQVVRSALPTPILDAIEMQTLGESGLQIRVDGDYCVSNIGVWPNGCCDLEHLYVASESGEFLHLEFTSIVEAAERLISEVQLAVHRATGAQTRISQIK